MWKKVWKKEKYIAETEIGKKYSWIEFSEKGLYEILVIWKGIGIVHITDLIKKIEIRKIIGRRKT